MLKRILAAVMSAAMILSMSSCGKGQASKSVETTEDGKKIVKMYAWYIEDTSIYSHISEFNKA
ncbi:MAG: hypothetical protein K2J72_04720, partial [Oscillospiraceae bacterium]|nr:hypothetical protein [Oscillospiraceae bacterium]